MRGYEKTTSLDDALSLPATDNKAESIRVSVCAPASHKYRTRLPLVTACPYAQKLAYPVSYVGYYRSHSPIQ